MKQEQNKNGSILLLTLIITMILLSSSIVLGTLIVGSLRRTQSKSFSISAFYIAEGLIEKSLYGLRRENKIPKEIETGVCSALPAGSFEGIDSDACHARAEYSTKASFGTMKQNQSVQIKLVDPDGVSTKANINNIRIFCTNTSAWIEATLTPISYYSGSLDQWMPKPEETKKYLFPCFSYTSGSYPINLNTEYSYNVVMRALYSQANNVLVNACKDAQCLQPAVIGNNFVINAWVDYPYFSRQNVKVEVQGVSTLPGLLDYVIFSETALKKDTAPVSSP